MSYRTLLLALSIAAAATTVAPTVSAQSLPYNPYSGHREYDRAPDNPRRAQPAPRRGLYSGPRQATQLDRREYPHGLRGERYVHVEITAAERAEIVRQMRERAQSFDRQYVEALQNHDRAIRDYSQRLASLEAQRHASREHFEEWLNLRDYVRTLKQARETIRQDREGARSYFAQLTRFVEHSGNTTVVWRVVNHQKRNYVPASYLRSKTIAYLLRNTDRIGKSTRLNF